MLLMPSQKNTLNPALQPLGRKWCLPLGGLMFGTMILIKQFGNEEIQRKQ